jgi:hypothetical protein
LHRIYLFIVGLVVLALAFVSAFPAAIYTAQQFNTNLIVGVFGVVFLALAFLPHKS